MRKILLVLAVGIFLYSPYAPTWGKLVVNAAIVLSLFRFYARAVPRRRY